MAKVTFTIDGREVQVEAGLNLIEAARTIGVEIPHFCYHPGLGVDGNCRMCLVEVEGTPKPQIACNTFAKDGLKVHVNNENVRHLQQAVLEFLFLNHPLDCPICDQSGECYLQDYYMSNGQYQSRLDLPKVHKRKVVPVGPRVMLDAERCVLCTRCIRFCDQVTGTGELYIVNRSNRSEITTYPGVPLENDYSINTVDLCPVGALTSTDFRFKKRVWLLETTNSICVGCARGCNVYLEHDEGVAYRLRPRENMAVNQYWMCDPGRMTYKRLNQDRLEVPLQGGQEIPPFQALATFGAWVREIRESHRGDQAQVLLSPDSSTETLFALKRFASVVLGTERVSGIGTRPPGPEDALLRKADLYPNTAGLRLLGLEKDPESELARGGDLLIVVEDDPLAERPAWRERMSGFRRVIYLGTNENETSRAASLALPITAHSECEGTFVNFQGRVQRFHKGMVPRGDALWAPECLRRAMETIDLAFGWRNLDQLWTEVRGAEPALSGIELARVGDQGQLATRHDTVESSKRS